MSIQKLVDQVGLEPTVSETSGLQSESDTRSQSDPLFELVPCADLNRLFSMHGIEPCLAPVQRATKLRD